MDHSELRGSFLVGGFDVTWVRDWERGWGFGGGFGEFGPAIKLIYWL